MERGTDVMSTRLKQRAVIEFSTAENVNPTDIHRRLQTVYYGNETVDRSTVSCWASKCKLSEPGKMHILDKHRDGRRPVVTVTDDIHRSLVDEPIKNDRRVTQNRIADICWDVAGKSWVRYSATWLSKNLRLLGTENKLLTRYHQEGEQFLFDFSLP